MKVEYINPFIESVYGLCTTMLSCKVNRGDLALARSGAMGGDITGIIGLSGPARGTVALAFPMKTAKAMVGRLQGMEEGRESDDAVSDGVAELVNIVAGSAKAKFSNGDSPVINLSLPTVVRGTEYTIDYPSQATWLDVPFETDLGAFKLRVTFEFSPKKGING